MKRLLGRVLPVAVTSGLMFGCAAPEPAYTPTPFTPVRIDTSDSVQKVDTFAIVFDASLSMGGDVPTKFLYGKDIVNRMNQTIPPLDYETSFVVFGTGSCTKGQMAWQVYGPATYSQAALADSLGMVKCASGWSPLESGIDAAGAVLTPVAGNAALIIVSDFKELDNKAVMTSVQSLKSAMGTRLCIYPVQVGDNVGGTNIANEIAAAGGCASAVNADAIASANGMAAFVEGALLAPAPPPPVPVVMDSDGDGVPDSRDKCPNTPRGVPVTSEGCWILAGRDLLFEFNSARIRDTYVLDEAAKILLAEPGITGEIRGHTDSVGPEAYNMTLSQRRADAVLEYFVSKGVSPSRLRAVGYGETKPIASNDTDEGRALNRRVELKAD
jgi:OOP family OmpA-OmpF porin